MDTFSKRKRSSIMRAVRSSNNKSTELKLLKGFKQAGVSGWRRHLKLKGSPDIVFAEAKVAIFIDGCFWHGCSTHLRLPKTNVAYWRDKIVRNKKRDREVDNLLRRNGWLVLRLWEHAVAKKASLNRFLSKLKKLL